MGFKFQIVNLSDRDESEMWNSVVNINWNWKESFWKNIRKSKYRGTQNEFRKFIRLKSDTWNLGDPNQNLEVKYTGPHSKHPETKNIFEAKIYSKSGYPKCRVPDGLNAWGRAALFQFHIVTLRNKKTKRKSSHFFFNIPKFSLHFLKFILVFYTENERIENGPVRHVQGVPRKSPDVNVE